MRNRVPQRAAARWRCRLLSSVAIYAMAINTLAPFAAFAASASMSNANDANTTTPIKHVIVIIGENRTFDHLFATYKPVNKGEKVLNLLSEGIVQANGFPGPNYAAATQWHAQNTTTYQLSPGVKIPYNDPAAATGRGRIHSDDRRPVGRRTAAFPERPRGNGDREWVADQLLSVSDYRSRCTHIDPRQAGYTHRL